MSQIEQARERFVKARIEYEEAETAYMKLRASSEGRSVNDIMADILQDRDSYRNKMFDVEKQTG